MDTDTNEPDRFASLAEARAAYCELESESQSLLDEAGAKLSSLETDLNLANERADRAEADLAALQTEIAALKEGNAEQSAKIIALEANAKTAEAEAARIAASLGISPVEVGQNQAGGNQMGRKDFEQLSHKARREFLAAGGKIDQSTI